MSEAEDGDDASTGLPGDLVQSVAERLQEENSDLQRYGYHLALVPDDDPPEEGRRLPEDGFPPAGDGHWSEVEIQKLPNNDLSIRLRGYTETVGSEQERRMARLVRRLLREAVL